MTCFVISMVKHFGLRNFSTSFIKVPILLLQRYTEEAFDELCFEFGLELDEVVTEKDENGKEKIVYKVILVA